MSAACSQIDGQRAAVIFVVDSFEVLQRSDVHIGEVVYVDVVTNAGAVCGWQSDPRIWSSGPLTAEAASATGMR